MSRMIGPEAKLRVNGAIYYASGGDWELTADKADVTSTEDGFPVERDNTLVHLKMNFQGFLDNALNSPFVVAGLNIRASQYCAVLFYPYGLTGDAISAPTFWVESISGNFRVEGSPPQQLSMRGEGSGTYLLPQFTH